MVLDAALLNTQHYKILIKSKKEQPRERCKRPLLHLSVVTIEKVAFGAPSTMVANFTFYMVQNNSCLIIVICLHTVIWFQVFQADTTNLQAILLFLVINNNNDKSGCKTKIFKERAILHFNFPKTLKNITGL